MRLSTIFIAILCLFLFACQQRNEVSITLDPSECGKEEASIVYNGKNYDFEEDDKGILSVVVPGVDKPVYAHIKVKKRVYEIYLTPGAVMTLKPNFTTKENFERLTGEGDHNEINTYLNGRPHYRYGKFYLATDKEFVDGLNQFVAERINELQETGFEESFIEIESYRIRFEALKSFEAYTKYVKYKNKDFVHTPFMVEAMTKDLKDGERYYYLAEYKLIAKSLSKILGTNGQAADPHKNVLQIVEYIDATFTNEPLKNELFDFFATKYIMDYSVSNATELIGFYDEKVSDENLKAAFDALVKDKTRLAKGQPSPVFNYPDVNGKMVSLKDFRGKVVFIDLWATWCGPCCAEIPYIKTLEHEFEGKDIVFVSISLDKDKKAWKAMLKRQKMDGVQLNFDGNRDFPQAYDSKSIPRFILIDADGNIVDSNAPRPSDPKLKTMLKSLL